MSVINFLKLQWIKRKLMIMSVILLSVLHFNFSSTYKDVHFKVMNILTGDHYYTIFTVMVPAKDEMTPLLVSELKNWTGIASITEINTKKLLKQIKKETSKYGVELPNLVTDTETLLYQIKVDPFIENEVVENIRLKILNHYPKDQVTASPIRFAEVATGNYNVMTLFFLQHGVFLLFSLLTILIIGGNAILFYKMVTDAVILQSINRSKALSLKNYLIFQLSILILAMIAVVLFTGSVSVLTILLWITTQSILAFVFYGVWGRNYQV